MTLGLVCALVVPAAAQAGGAGLSDCFNYSTGTLSLTSNTVTWGEETQVKWATNVPQVCTWPLPFVGIYRNGTDHVAGTVFGDQFNGYMAITPLVTSDYVLRLDTTIGEHKDLARISVTVNPYDAKPLPPEEANVSIPFGGPVFGRIFLRAMQTPNAVVRIAGGVDLDLSGLQHIRIQHGVQIIGDRRSVGSGPRLFTTTFPDILFMIGDDGGDAPSTSDNIRITGIRLDGGESDDPFSAVGSPDADGIEVYSSQNIEIDHNEIYRWRGSAVSVHDGQHHINQANAKTVWVHDNFIHHNQHASSNNCIATWLHDGHATGYGVAVSNGAYAQIEQNVFDYNRHAITGDGREGTGYLAYRNLVLTHGGDHFKCVNPSDGIWGFILSPFSVNVVVTVELLDPYWVYHTHQIDMHGRDSTSGDYMGGLAGEYMDIEYNTILYTAGNAIHLRGTPTLGSNPDDSPPATTKVGMDVRHNVFAHEDEWAGIFQGILSPGALLQNETGLHQSDNAFGANTFDDRKSCDFDGDGTDDDFIATGVTWWFGSSAAGGRWTYLAQSSRSVSQVQLGDVTGDGRCDVTADGTVFPTAADGSAEWVYQNSDGSMQAFDPNQTLSFRTGAFMTPNTSPAVADLGDGGIELAFVGTDQKLWRASPETNFFPAGFEYGTSVDVAPGTSPALASNGQGGWRIAVQGSNGHLWTVDSTAGVTDTGAPMAAGSSPSLAYLPSAGGYEIAFTHANGLLFRAFPDTNWFQVGPGFGVAPGTSPAIATSNNGWKIAFHAQGDHLWTVEGPNATDTGAPMAAGSSPSLAYLSSAGGYEIAFTHANGLLFRAFPDTNWFQVGAGYGVAPGTSPAIATINNHWAIAFHAQGDSLWTVEGTSVDNLQGFLRPGTSPAIAARTQTPITR